MSATGNGLNLTAEELYLTKRKGIIKFSHRVKSPPEGTFRWAGIAEELELKINTL